MNVTAADVKRTAREWDADLCGIASADRFSDVPESYRRAGCYARRAARPPRGREGATGRE